MKASPFVHVIQLPDSRYEILYNAITLGLVAIKKGVFPNNLKNKNPNIISKLKTMGMIVLNEETGYEVLERSKSFFKRKILGVLCLMLTEGCNLRCRYCFIEHKFAKNHIFRSLTPEMAKTGIDVFIRHLPKSIEDGLLDPTISFYGGEPLINFKTLEWSLQYIADKKESGKLPSNTFLTLNTNATLVSAQIARVLKKYNVAASVSLDGPQLIHNKARPDVFGKGSFTKVINGINLLREHRVDMGISCAVAMHNLDSLEDIARWYLDEIGVDVFGFNILLDGGLPEPNFNLTKYSEKLAGKMVNCFKIAREKGKIEERSFRLAKSFAEGKIHYYDCSACGQQLVVDPKGRFGPCHAYIHSDKNFVSPEDSPDIFSHPLWQEWRSRSPLNMRECQKCVALGICGGGCPYNAEVRKGSIWDLDESFCGFAQSLIALFIKEVGEKILSNQK